ncbi:MAG: VWA domain-containing protein [Methanoculleus sp.]
MMILSFENPAWLAGLCVIPALILYNRHYSKRKYLQALEFSKLSTAKAAAARTKHGRVHRTAFWMGLLAIALIVAGLADPQIPLGETRDGVNVVLALDVSGSMKATDYQPNRITAAKVASENLIRQLDRKDYVGIVTFDSGATTSAYLTPDRQRVIEKLQYIDAKDGSTAIGDGLALAVDMAQSIPNRKCVVILLSDGESNSGYVSLAAASGLAKERGIQVFTVAMGSEEPVLVGYDRANNPEYATVNEEVLQEIAQNTGGACFRSVDEGTLQEIYAKLDDAIVRETEKTPVGWAFFLVSAGLLTAEYFIRYGRWRFLP